MVPNRRGQLQILLATALYLAVVASLMRFGGWARATGGSAYDGNGSPDQGSPHASPAALTSMEPNSARDSGGAPGSSLSLAVPTDRPAWLPTPSRDEALQSELEAYLDGKVGTYGLAACDLDSGRTVFVNGDRIFSPASTYKLLVMYRVFQEVDQGTLSLSGDLTITENDAVEDIEPDGGLWPGTTVTVGDALEAMITLSSNTAAYALVRRVGGWGALEAAAADLQMGQTVVNGGFATSPADMLRFLVLLDRGQLAGEQTTRAMIGLLLRQTVNDRLPALLPSEAQVAHKTGELPGVRNDVGIIYSPSGRIAIAVFSQDVDEQEAVSVIAELTRRVYERYAVGSPAAPPQAAIHSVRPD